MWAALRLIGSHCLKREGLAFAALGASIVGAGVLTILLFYAMHGLRGAAQWEAMANLAYGLLATVAIIIISFGFLLTKRTMEAEFWKVKFKASGGSDDPDIP